ncbi:unnamed protein product [Rotaria sp. Silwood1]|nr:unnamed protein product [Rotaria sp. Silwood1]
MSHRCINQLARGVLFSKKKASATLTLSINGGPIARPVQNDSDTLPITINLALQQIINFDGKNEAIVISGWMTIKWNDYSLRWKPEQFGNIQTLRIPRVNLTAESSQGQVDAYVENAEWYLEVPCFLISCMTILGFLLSPDSGEKLTLRELEFDDKKCVFIHFKSSEITILLSVIMFSLLLSEILPSSSTAIPIITVYFMCVMIMTAVSVVASVLILSLHHRSPSNYAMPSWVRKYICNYLAWLLHMKRPNHDLTWRSIRRRWASPKQESDNLLGTIDNHQTKIPSEPLFDNTFELLSTNVINIDKKPLENQEKQHLDSILESAVPRAAEIHGPDYHQKTSNELYTCDMDTAHSELRVIISQLAILINYSRQKEKDDNESQDWQFVAMVIDRLCLVFFSIIMFLFTALTFLHV